MPIKRLPNVKTLASIIPSGTEGGKEFARIIDLLLYQEYRRKDKIVSIFDDSSGDFRALDSFESTGRKAKKYIGYQYKFYPSPLSASHRKNICDSIKAANGKFKKGALERFVLITPDDFTNSAVKKTGGDVEWFDNLQQYLNVDFKIEHWGHKKILALFLETPSIGLFYYPELYQGGKILQKQVLETKDKYVRNLIDLHNSIEFVGMSMYKPEADKGIQMQDIYIPLNVQPESVDDSAKTVSIINPLIFLAEGEKTVILGDPGSGKSTLLKFLTLSGISPTLQGKYNCQGSDRLPIHIVLRKYADELKSRINLSILDYIQEYVQATFNLKAFDFSFLEYFLDSGKVIFLLDGLDELPDSDFKTTIRDRVRSMLTTYPGNTVIVTSRIVGYDNPFRFDRKEFNHYKVAKLLLHQMEQFVSDWYKVRIENESERKANIEDLISILKDQNHTAIRELAENPLLLTIITLVHRIDAVLPDQRVVLYQKCTETLLNTWQIAKFKAGKNKTSIEIRNKRRLEAIAHWMQEQSTGVGKTQRSVVPYIDLINFLSDFITTTERLNEGEEAIDLANEYLDFIKDRAGLLIEVGDQSYSFVHLTFQEYLTATYLMAKSEKNGIVSLKEDLVNYSKDARWYEVVRLLIASLKSEDSQEFIISTILDVAPTAKSNIAVLLGGILLDGVIAAELRKSEIIEYILITSLKSKTVEEIRSFSSILKNWISKDPDNYLDIDHVCEALLLKFNDVEKINLLLLCECSNISTDYIKKQRDEVTGTNEKLVAVFNLFFGRRESLIPHKKLLDEVIRDFIKAEKLAVTTSPMKNFCGVAMMAINFSYDYKSGLKSLFEIFMTALGTGVNYGPFHEIIINIFLISGTDYNFSKKNLKGHVNNNTKELEASVNELVLGVVPHENSIDARNSKYDVIRDNVTKTMSDSLLKTFKNASSRAESSGYNQFRGIDNDIWQIFQDDHKMSSVLLDLIVGIVGFSRKPLWYEAIRVSYFPKIGNRFLFLNNSKVNVALLDLTKQNPRESSIYLGACLLIIESWTIVYNEQRLFTQQIIEISKIAKEREFLPLKVADLILQIVNDNSHARADLQKLYMSSNKENVELFTSCHWKPNRFDIITQK